jgi:pre-mRNA-splicing factor CWC22
MASPQFSPIFAALVAVVNTKFPELGELVLKRVILQFRRAFKRNDKTVCVAGADTRLPFRSSRDAFGH